MHGFGCLPRAALCSMRSCYRCARCDALLQARQLCLVSVQAAFSRSHSRILSLQVQVLAHYRLNCIVTRLAAERAVVEYPDFSNLNSNAQEIAQIYDIASLANSPSITNATHSMV